MSKKTKKELVLQNKKNKRKSIITISISSFLAVTVIISIAIIQNNVRTKKPQNISEILFKNDPPSNKGITYTKVSGTNGKIEFTSADFQDGIAKYYQYDSNGKNVNFFVLKSSDNVIRSAFDACDVCYEAQLGYRQEGDLMVCNNCGRRFPSVKINVEEGGCNPAPLERIEADGLIVINTAAIDSGIRFF
jgi:uncharacterized membrane protein